MSLPWTIARISFRVCQHNYKYLRLPNAGVQMAKPKVSKYKTINLQQETYDALDKLKQIEQEPFDSVVKRLLREHGA